MVNFQDDVFAPMVQDRSSNDKSSSNPSKSSSGKTSSSSSGSSRTSSSRRGLKPSRSSRRVSSRSLESGESKSSSGSSRPSTSSSSSTRHRSSRRASSSRESHEGKPKTPAVSEEAVDYGYGSQEDPVDYGYGDEEEQAPQQPQRSRRQRRCSIADVMSEDSGDDVDAAAFNRYANNKTVDRQSNIAVPMAADEPKKKDRGRRGSMLGLGGFDKPAKEPERKQKKPGVDRDRRRQGTLMDRVGASGR